VLSRVAENLYWLGRYLERADNVARLADANFQATVEQLPAGVGQGWEAVVNALGAHDLYADAVEERPDLTHTEFVLHAAEYPQSVRASIGRARSLARELREHLSREVFEEINRLYLAYPGASRGADERSTRTFTASVRRTVASIVGLFDNTVLLTEGREWFRCGLFLERADMTSRIVDSKYFVILPSADDVGGPLDRYQWMAVLRSASALEAFRKRYRGAVSGPRVADLLMFDPDFPRSLTFCVGGLKRHFQRAVNGSDSPHVVEPEREITLLELDLRAADVRDVITTGLHEFLDEFQLRLIRIDDVLTQHLFRALPEDPGHARLRPVGNNVPV